MSITVTNTLHDSGGNPIVGAKCPVVLIGAAAFDAGNIEIVGQAGTVTTDSTGTWSTTALEPNSTLQPTGTYYMVYEPNASHAFTVPATGGPYTLNQLLVSSPTSPAASLGIVRYDVAQPLTPAQQAQAQQNIGTSGGSGAVASVFGRTGAVVAQSGDYTAAQVGADASGAAAAAQAASLQKSSNLSDVANAATSRTNLGLGSAATQDKVAAGSAGVLDATDPSTTNARTPTAHASTHAPAGSDPIIIAESQVTGLVTDLAAKVPTSRQLAGLDLTADRTAAAIKAALAITEADVSGLTADLAARALVMAPTATKTTAYTAAVNDLVLCDATTASFAVTLPTAPADKSILEVKKLDASANTVTITCGGTDTLAIGGTTLALALQGHAARLQYQSSTLKWIALDNDLPLVATDARYVGKSTGTAKGDTLAWTGSGTPTNVPVGSNGQVLTADSTQAAGVKWAAAAGGAFGLPVEGPAVGNYLGGYGVINTTNSGSSWTGGTARIGSIIIVPFAMTIDTMSINVDTTEAGTSAYALLYSCDSLGRPTTLVAQTPALSCATGGNVTGTLSAPVALTAGKYVGMIVSNSSGGAVRFRGWQQPNFNNYSDTLNNLTAGYNALMFNPGTYAAINTTISSWSYTFNAPNGGFPCVILHRSA